MPVTALNTTAMPFVATKPLPALQHGKGRKAFFGNANKTDFFQSQAKEAATASRQFEKQGNQYQINRQFKNAIQAYSQAIKQDKQNTNAIYNLAHTLIQSNQQTQSLPWFKYLLAIAPHDYQARAEYADQLEKHGQTQQALTQYEIILTEQPHYEPAVRRHADIHFIRAAQQFGGQVDALRQYYGQQKMDLAIQTLRHYLTQRGQAHRLDILNNIDVVFEPTVSIDNVSNVAEYDHATHPRPTIRFSPDMVFSHPDVIAAYLLHELVHAEDRDPLTSIREEQDAYREKTAFWLWRQSAMREPNLDFAAKLYQQSPTTLDERVANYYIMRDPSIPDTSPHHGQAHDYLAPYLSSAR